MDPPEAATPAPVTDAMGESWRSVEQHGTSGRGGHSTGQYGTRGRPAVRGTAHRGRPVTQANATALGSRGGDGLTQLRLDDVHFRVRNQTQGSTQNAPVPFPPSTQPQPSGPSPPPTPNQTPPQNQRRHSWGSLGDGLPPLGSGELPL
jgi:hypothetical protein